jgi:hypothetical protein
MGRRKGEATRAAVDRGWPHQVALPADQCRGGNYGFIHAFCRELSLCDRQHSVFHDDKWWLVLCFADRDHAEQFRERFGGVPFDPKDRGRGRQWARWRKTDGR